LDGGRKYQLIKKNIFGGMKKVGTARIKGLGKLIPGTGTKFLTSP
jgi:hypothetical protein